MGTSPKEYLERITTTSTTWGNLRPNKAFGGMTHSQFQEKIAPSLAARATIARLEDELIAAHNQRDDADAVSVEAVQLVVNGIKGDPEEGEDGEFYEALGFVRKSERKSGLSRKAKTSATTAKA